MVVTKLIQLNQRVRDLEALADEIVELSNQLLTLEDIKTIQPTLSNKGQQWYRGCRALLVQHNFSGIDEFECCYTGRIGLGDKTHKAFEYIEQFIQYGNSEYRSSQVWYGRTEPDRKDHHGLFMEFFSKARSLVLSLQEELLSRELPITTQLSFEVVGNELDTAMKILEESQEDVFVRVAGVIARVALERHLLTMIDSRSLQMIVNPPTKQKAEASDYIRTLTTNGLITAIQKSQLEHLFKVGTNCAHPKEVVALKDVQDMVRSAKDICSVLV